jgi:hypothetical protein
MRTKNRVTALFLALTLITAFYSCAEGLDNIDPYDIIHGNYTPDKKIVAIEITSFPHKLTYEISENADWTGLEITEIYSDNTKTITAGYHSYDISGFDSSSPGIKTITVVAKNGFSVTFTVTVLPREGTSAITILPPSQAGDITLSSTGTTTVTVTASGGYTDYQWFVDDMPADSNTDGKTITLDSTAYSAGKHLVWVTAHQQGLPYSAETVITIIPLP